MPPCCPEHPWAWSLCVRVSAGPDQALSISSPLSSLPKPPRGGWGQEGFAADAPIWGGRSQTPWAGWGWSTPCPPFAHPIAHPSPTPCPCALPGTARFSVLEGPILQGCPGGGLSLLCPPSPSCPALSQTFFFFLPPNTTKPPNPLQLRNLFLFLFSLCFLPRQSIDWS